MERLSPALDPPCCRGFHGGVTLLDATRDKGGKEHARVRNT
jgi:hypothetical protein